MVVALTTTFFTASVLSGTLVLEPYLYLAFCFGFAFLCQVYPPDLPFSHLDRSRFCSMKHFHISLLKSSDKSRQFLPFDMASPIVSAFIFFNFECVHLLWFRFFRSPLLDTDRFRRGFWGTNRRVRERHGAIRQQSCSKKKTSTSNFYNVGANHPPWSKLSRRNFARPPFIQSTPRS